MLSDITTDLAQSGLDTCTLNNALNVAQLYVLVRIIQRLRLNGDGRQERRPSGERE